LLGLKVSTLRAVISIDSAGLGIPPAPRGLATDAEMTEADDLHVSPFSKQRK